MSGELGGLFHGFLNVVQWRRLLRAAAAARSVWSACSLLPLWNGTCVRQRQQAARTPNASRVSSAPDQSEHLQSLQELCQRTFNSRVLAVLGLLCLPLWGHAAPAHNVQSGVAQLFIDDGMIAQQSGLRRTLHQPVKDNDGNRPWLAAGPGSMLLAYGSIVRDPRLNRYVMFVQKSHPRHLFRLTSADGLDWQPNTCDQLEPVSLDMSFPPLPPEAHGTPGMDLFSCYYDTADTNRPYKGWVWAANVGNEWEGVWFVSSADGLHWQRGRQVLSGFAGEGDPSCRVITQDGRTLYGPGDVTLFAHDPVEHRFLGLFKFYSPRDLASHYGSRARAYAFLEGLDRPFDTQRLERIQLMPAMAARNGDLPADEYYASTAWRYEQHRGCRSPHPQRRGGRQ